MVNRDKEEEKNKRIGWLTSVGVQLVLLVLFYFIVAWKEPFPPIPEYGIELGFTSSSGATSASPAPQATETEVENEVLEQPQEDTQSETTSESSEEIQNSSEVDESSAVEESVQETPDVVETTEKSTVEKPEAKPAEVPKVDERAVMGATSKKSPSEEESAGTEGEEKEEIDQRAIYGTQGAKTGNTEGASLSLAGWVWDFKPNPNDTSAEAGKIVYKIVVDQDGYLVKIEPITSTVSPAVERKYREAVTKLTFSKTSDYKTAARSTGTITFIIKSR
ncbi:MAG: hypothetical protein Tsb0034_00650 [Ekhidna sp.]